MAGHAAGHAESAADRDRTGPPCAADQHAQHGQRAQEVAAQEFLRNDQALRAVISNGDFDG